MKYVKKPKYNTGGQLGSAIGSTATSFIPGVGPLLAPLGGMIGGMIGKGLYKEKQPEMTKNIAYSNMGYKYGGKLYKEGGQVSIVDYLSSQGVDSSFSNRKKLAEQKGITDYKGTAEQNLSLLTLLKNELDNTQVSQNEFAPQQLKTNINSNQADNTRTSSRVEYSPKRVNPIYQETPVTRPSVNTAETNSLSSVPKDTSRKGESSSLNTKIIRTLLPFLPFNARQAVAATLTGDTKLSLEELPTDIKVSLYNAIESAHGRQNTTEMAGTNYADYGDKNLPDELVRGKADLKRMIEGSINDPNFRAATTLGRVSYKYNPNNDTFDVYDSYDFGQKESGDTMYSKIRSFFGNANKAEETPNYVGSFTREGRGFKYGGKVKPIGNGAKKYVGPKHENGGILIDEEGNPANANQAIAEVEGGETEQDGYIFSDTLIVPNTEMTFADAHEMLIAEGAPQEQIDELAAMQEQMNGGNSEQEMMQEPMGEQMAEPMMQEMPEEMPEEMMMAKGGLIKRADGSYSRRGLWDNIRANKGSGKKPTPEMLAQERKIKAKEMTMGGKVVDYNYGGVLPKYIDGGDTVRIQSGSERTVSEKPKLYSDDFQEGVRMINFDVNNAPTDTSYMYKRGMNNDAESFYYNTKDGIVDYQNTLKPNASFNTMSPDSVNMFRNRVNTLAGIRKYGGGLPQYQDGGIPEALKSASQRSGVTLAQKEAAKQAERRALQNALSRGTAESMRSSLPSYGKSFLQGTGKLAGRALGAASLLIPESNATAKHLYNSPQEAQQMLGIKPINYFDDSLLPSDRNTYGANYINSLTGNTPTKRFNMMDGISSPEPVVNTPQRTTTPSMRRTVTEKPVFKYTGNEVNLNDKQRASLSQLKNIRLNDSGDILGSTSMLKRNANLLKKQNVDMTPVNMGGKNNMFANLDWGNIGTGLQSATRLGAAMFTPKPKALPNVNYNPLSTTSPVFEGARRSAGAGFRTAMGINPQAAYAQYLDATSNIAGQEADYRGQREAMNEQMRQETQMRNLDIMGRNQQAKDMDRAARIGLVSQAIDIPIAKRAQDEAMKRQLESDLMFSSDRFSDPVERERILAERRRRLGLRNGGLLQRYKKRK